LCRRRRRRRRRRKVRRRRRRRRRKVYSANAGNEGRGGVLCGSPR